MWLIVRSGSSAGRKVQITDTRLVIGRDSHCDVPIDDEKASRNHAYLQSQPDGSVVVGDLGSTNGTFVNGRRIDGPTVLRGGEEIRIGTTHFFAAMTESEVLPPVATVAASRPPGPATQERQMLRRSVKRSTILAAAALGLAVVVIALFTTGVLPPEDEPTPTPTAPTLAQIVREARPSVVLVETSVDGEVNGWGSGWVYDAEEGLIVTNGHVVNGSEEFEVGLAGDDGVVDEATLRPAEVVAVAPCEDLAVLRVHDTTGLRTIELGSLSELEQGDPVTSLGFPSNLARGYVYQQSDGTVAVVNQELVAGGVDIPAYPSVIQTTAAINSGNSGGPLVDLQGRVVGVSSASTFADVAENQGFAVSIDRVKEIVPTLVEGRSIGWTGASLEWSDDFTFINGAVPGTPAADAGFDDSAWALLAIDGQTLQPTLSSYCRIAGGIQSGGEAEFTLYDGVEFRDVPVGFA